MRWFWIDRFVEFESGSRAVAVKNISLIEEQMIGYVPGFPAMPASLIIEGLAQTGGLLVCEHNQFQERVVLAKVTKARFPQPAMAGDTLIYTALIQDIREDGAICRGTCHVQDQLRAEVELVFAHLDDSFQEGDLFDPANFLRTLRTLRLFEVGRNSDGEPLPIPSHMLAAEEADNHQAGDRE